MSALLIQGVAKKFGRTDVLSELSLDVAEGEFMVLLGPSGCGKSTLLNIIAGLDKPDTGHIVIGGVDVTELEPRERNIAMVFQSYALYPTMNVRKNMGFGLRMRGVPRAEADHRVEEAARLLQIENLLKRRPGQLSGGQRQRVAIGRAIVHKPAIFLFDEPLSNLDAKLRGETRLELKELHRRLGATIVYVTHDQVEAMTLANRIAVLNRGVIEQVGSPQEIYDRPATAFVAGFTGSPPMNMVPGWPRIAGEKPAFRPDGSGVNITLTDEQAATPSLGSRKLLLGLRPEHVGAPHRIESAGKRVLELEMVLVEPTGADTQVIFALGDTRIVGRYRPDEVPPFGKAEVALDLSHAALFDKESGQRLF